MGLIRRERLAPVISELEKELNRPIIYVFYSEEEWNEKKEIAEQAIKFAKEFVEKISEIIIGQSRLRI